MHALASAARNPADMKMASAANKAHENQILLWRPIFYPEILSTLAFTNVLLSTRSIGPSEQQCVSAFYVSVIADATDYKE